MSWGLSIAVSTVALVAFSVTARADDTAEAATLVEQGQALAGEDKFAEALTLFRRAVDLDPKPALACNVGMAHYALDHFDRAHVWLSRCAVHSDDAAVAEVLTFVRNKLEGQGLIEITITTPVDGATVTCGDYRSEGPQPAPQKFYLEAGSHPCTVSKSGFRDNTLSVEVSTTSNRTVEVRLEPEQTIKDEPVSDNGTIDEPVEPLVTRSTPARRSRWARPGAWAAVAGGAAGIATGIVLRNAATSIIQEDLLSATEGPSRSDDIARVRTREVLSWGALGLGAVSFGLGFYLFARDDGPHEQLPVAVGPAPGGTGGMVWLQWSR